MELQPYLLFTGNCEEALNFYKNIFGGEIAQLSRYKDAPPDDPASPQLRPEDRERVMHATFRSPDFTFMASDARPGKQYGEGPISLSLGLSDVAVAQRIFDGLAQGGTVEMPLEDTFWGAKFGMLTDKFGIDWMVNCQLQGASVN